MERRAKSMSLEKKENKTLDEFASVMATNLLGTSKEPYAHIWPAPVVNILEARWYTLSHFPRTLNRLIQQLERRKIPQENIAKLWGGPSRICLFLFWVDGKSLLRMPKEEVVELTLKLIRYVSSLRKGDIYCRNGKNFLLDPASLSKLVDDFAGFDLGDDEQSKRIRKLVGTINASLWLYTELLYFACHSWGHEFHGPYDLGENRSLVVREYYDLKPPVWDFSKSLKADKFTTFEIYKTAEIAFDMFNRTRSKGSPLSKLQAFSIRIGGIRGEPIERLNDIEKLGLHVMNAAEEAAISERKLGKKQLIEKFAETTYYCGIRPLADVLGEDWRVPSEVYEAIEREDALRSEFLTQKLEGIKRGAELPSEVLWKILRDSFDPRVM